MSCLPELLIISVIISLCELLPFYFHHVPLSNTSKNTSSFSRQSSNTFESHTSLTIWTSPVHLVHSIANTHHSSPSFNTTLLFVILAPVVALVLVFCFVDLSIFTKYFVFITHHQWTAQTLSHTHCHPFLCQCYFLHQNLCFLYHHNYWQNLLLCYHYNLCKNVHLVYNQLHFHYILLIFYEILAFIWVMQMSVTEAEQTALSC